MAKKKHDKTYAALCDMATNGANHVTMVTDIDKIQLIYSFRIGDKHAEEPVVIAEWSDTSPESMADAKRLNQLLDSLMLFYNLGGTRAQVNAVVKRMPQARSLVFKGYTLLDVVRVMAINTSTFGCQTTDTTVVIDHLASMIRSY